MTNPPFTFEIAPNRLHALGNVSWDLSVRAGRLAAKRPRRRRRPRLAESSRHGQLRTVQPDHSPRRFSGAAAYWLIH